MCARDAQEILQRHTPIIKPKTLLCNSTQVPAGSKVIAVFDPVTKEFWTSLPLHVHTRLAGAVLASTGRLFVLPQGRPSLLRLRLSHAVLEHMHARWLRECSLTNVLLRRMPISSAVYRTIMPLWCTQ